MPQIATPRILDLALSLEVAELPIAGTLQHGTTQPQQFDGWLELIAAIESALNTAREPPPPTCQP
jgi:hypothetical protein